jgi:hypothetical protein
LDFLVTGKLKFHGHIVNAGRKRAFHVQEFHNPTE